MISRFEYHPEAEAEFDAQVRWYAEQAAPDVAARFADSVLSAIKGLFDFPGSGRNEVVRTGKPTIQSYGAPRFPHRIIYFVDGDTLFVLAVASTHRRPGYWKTRIE